jgi:hypothetical protein
VILAWTLGHSERLEKTDENPNTKNTKMSESCVMLHVARLPEGGDLATSEAIQGLVAQGRTAAETLEIAHYAAGKLLEVQQLRG